MLPRCPSGQRSLGAYRLIAATSGSAIGRLEAKGWVRREADQLDKRRKLMNDWAAWVLSETDPNISRFWLSDESEIEITKHGVAAQ